MSVPVALDALAEQVATMPSPPFLVTASPQGQVHLVSASVSFDGARFSGRAGRTSSRNIDANPAVTLLWAGAPGEPYSLIVDGTAAVDGDGAVTVVPDRAVLHRVADAPADLPSCVPIEAGAQE